MSNKVNVGAVCRTCGKFEYSKRMLWDKWMLCPLCEAGWHCPKCWGHHWAECFAKAIKQQIEMMMAGITAELGVSIALMPKDSHPFWQCYICGDPDVVGSCMDCGESVCVDDSAPESIGLICGNCRKANVAK